jgi:hypothetical protein
MNVSYDKDNATHIGKSLIEFYQDIPLLFLYIKLFTGERAYINERVKYCQFLNQRKVNGIVNYFSNIVDKFYCKDLLTCPIKKGIYNYTFGRERLVDPTKTVPLFIPYKGNVTLRIEFKVKLGNSTKLISMANDTHVFEFYK